jgi:hypothetical protein
MIVVCAICVSPFWFLASRWDDWDEALKTGVGAALVAVVTLILRYVGGEKKNE